MSITKSLLLSLLLAGCFLISGPLANAEDADADVDVGCRTSESLAAFQDEAEPGLLVGADMSVVYENVLMMNPLMWSACIIADADTFTVGKDLGEGFSEAVLKFPDGVTMSLVVATPAMDDVGEPAVALKPELPANAAVVSKTTTAPCSTVAVMATVYTVDNGECQ